MDKEARKKADSAQDGNLNGKADGGSSSVQTHKRSLSGSILAKLPFLKPAAEDHTSTRSTALVEKDAEHLKSNGETASNSATLAYDSKKPRRRKGSLRKTALLGTGRSRQERKAINQDGGGRQTLNTQRRHPSSFLETGNISETSPVSPPGSFEPSTFGFENVSASKEHSDVFNNGVYIPTMAKSSGVSSSGLNMNLDKSSRLDVSTTDEEEGLAFPRAVPAQPLKKPGATSSDYFTSQNGSLQRRRSNNRAQTPLEVSPVDGAIPPEDWDYAATEWWGWVVLIVTWIVFVVGMGSCFEVWSWAWDVGETPYAPPELEDDPTLPVVGYYPALIILTGVMAWVWVVIAWVGMKYFKHAKISGEET